MTTTTTTTRIRTTINNIFINKPGKINNNNLTTTINTI
tara:strand:+ start:676 stop:789 length:114 start_codon:yes stop_codon:yes gene_type:complete